jgi:hypothetical protein
MTAAAIATLHPWASMNLVIVSTKDSTIWNTVCLRRATAEV